MNKLLPILLVVGLAIIPELSFANDMHTRTGSTGGSFIGTIILIVAGFFAVLNMLTKPPQEWDGLTAIAAMILGAFLIGHILHG